VHRQQTGVVAVAHRRVQHRHRFGFPAQAEVALVGGHQHTAFASPADHLAEVVDAEHGAGRVARRVEEDQRGRPGADLGQRIRAHDLGVGQPGADVVGRVGQLGHHDRVIGPQPDQRGKPRDEFLGADHGQHGTVGEIGDAVPPLERGRHRRPQRGGAGRRRVAGRRTGRSQGIPDHRGDRVHGGTHRQVDDAVGVCTCHRRHVGERVPREDR
jgi:hypothetical protein